MFLCYFVDAHKSHICCLFPVSKSIVTPLVPPSVKLSANLFVTDDDFVYLKPTHLYVVSFLVVNLIVPLMLPFLLLWSQI